jgi:hypothetical protein
MKQLLVGLLLASSLARAEGAFSLFSKERAQKQEAERLARDAKKVQPELDRLGVDAGYLDEAGAFLNGLGAKDRMWELSSDTGFGAARVFTERIEAARALQIPGSTIAITLRVGVGADAATNTGFYALQGPTASIGFKHQTEPGDFSFEAGFRILPGWSGPGDSEPAAQQLALGATLASGIADDARWLPLNSTGVQLYLEIQSRTRPHPFKWATVLFGTRYGGAGSIMPIEIRSWLGPQREFVANVYAEVFFAVADIRVRNVSDASAKSYPIRAQVGVHVDASLSSIWPGNDPFPLVVNGFLGWSPAKWLAIRAFLGTSGSLQGAVPFALQYGLRLQFYLP